MFDQLKNSIDWKVWSMEKFDRNIWSIEKFDRFALFRLDFSSDFLPIKRAIVTTRSDTYS